jgi:hypothetical protein
MKRFCVILSATIICMALSTAFVAAQGYGEPSEQSVLEAARTKYLAEQAEAAAIEAEAAAEEAQRVAEAAAEAAEAAAEAAERSAEQEYDQDDTDEEWSEGSMGFSPFVLAFVPGLSFPFGTYDAAFSAGAIGVLTRDVYGFQGAGVFGLARNVNGFQGGGVFCIAEGSVNGFQGSGVFNIAEGGVNGVQTAGVFNIAEGESASPFQAAGVFNIAESISGAQFAGVFNIADSVDGAQFAGVVNVAGSVDGAQVGLVNIADRVDGIQLGLVNIARDPGLSSQGLYYEPDSDYASAAFQAGSRGMYTLFTAGLPYSEWTSTARGLVLSLGVGTRVRLGGFYLDIDASAASFAGPELPAIGAAIESGEPMADATGLIPYPSLRAMIGLPILGRFHLVAGFKADVDLDDAPRVPEALKRGTDYSSRLFGVGYRAWIKPFFGVKL